MPIKKDDPRTGETLGRAEGERRPEPPCRGLSQPRAA